MQKQEQGTVKAQIAGIMAGANSSVYESILRDIATKRRHIENVLKRAGYQSTEHCFAVKAEDAAIIVTKAVAAVDEVLNAPDNCLTPAEKQGLLAKVIEAIYPEGTDGLRIQLKHPLDINQSVAYFTT